VGLASLRKIIGIERAVAQEVGYAEAGHDMDRLREVEASHHSIENEGRGHFLG